MKFKNELFTMGTLGDIVEYHSRVVEDPHKAEYYYNYKVVVPVGYTKDELLRIEKWEVDRLIKPLPKDHPAYILYGPGK